MKSNRILKTALEELAVSVAQQSEAPSDGEQQMAPTDMPPTGVQVPVPTEREQELEGEVIALNDELDTVEMQTISTNSDSVSKDLTEAVQAAEALESLALNSYAVASAGKASHVSNGFLLMAVNGRLESARYPKLGAALESALVTADPNDAARSIGDRAKEIAMRMYRSILEFFKKIGAWFSNTLGKLLDRFGTLATRAEALNKPEVLEKFKGKTVIDNEGLIASLGMVNNNGLNDYINFFKYYGVALAALSSNGVTDAVKRVATSSNKQEMDQTIVAFTGVLTREMFPEGGGVGADGISESKSPAFIGSTQFVYRVEGPSPTGKLDVKISLNRPEAVTGVTSVDGLDYARVTELLKLISGLKDNVTRAKSCMSNLEQFANSSLKSAIERADKEVGEGVQSSVSASLNNFMALTNALVVNFTPLLLTAGAQNADRFLLCVRHAKPA